MGLGLYQTKKLLHNKKKKENNNNKISNVHVLARSVEILTLEKSKNLDM